MKLSDVVRGVEIKDMSQENFNDLVYRPPLRDGDTIPAQKYINYDERRGYNSLASAEVVVDREQIRQIIDTSTENCIAENMTVEEVVACNTNAVYAALNSGSIISLKGEE